MSKPLFMHVQFARITTDDIMYQMYVAGNRLIGCNRILLDDSGATLEGWIVCPLDKQEIEFCNRINEMNW